MPALYRKACLRILVQLVASMAMPVRNQHVEVGAGRRKARCWRERTLMSGLAWPHKQRQTKASREGQHVGSSSGRSRIPGNSRGRRRRLQTGRDSCFEHWCSAHCFMAGVRCGPGAIALTRLLHGGCSGTEPEPAQGFSCLCTSSAVFSDARQKCVELAWVKWPGQGTPVSLVPK